MNEVGGEEQNLVEDGGLRANGMTENVNNGHGRGALQGSGASQIPQQQQSQGAIGCWERFLHLRSLKVLLVENDDSTRHVVTALLHNCSYEVIEAANVLQAWKILEDLTNHIDLVLTEVVMPCLSGIGLLCKIMNHKTRKNVPVIMMSSHDSMGLVFKCLSKGAVDFLVKPIRKNELKNLWQHVWRRCHSSSGSGSGSESGTQTQKSVKSKGVEKSDNNFGSNDEGDDSFGLNIRDGSDNGSGTQSSWTKQAVEVDSPRPEYPWDQVAECPDSTCAQVIHSIAEISGNKQVAVTTTNERGEQGEQLVSFPKNVATGQISDVVVPRNIDLQLEHPVKDPTNIVGTKQNKLLFNKGHLDLNIESSSSNLKYEAANLSNVPSNTADPHMNTREFAAPIKHSKISDIKNKAIIDTKEIPSLELGLKRHRGVKDVGTPVQDDRNVLRRSDSSAFSRYNAASNANKITGGHSKNSSAHDIRLDPKKRGPVCNFQSHSNGGHPNHSSNAGSNNIDMGSTTNNTFTKSVVLKNKSGVTSAVKCLHPPSTLQPVKGDSLYVSPQIVSDKVDDVAGTTMLAQQVGSYQEIQTQHLTHHYDDCHLLHKMQMQQKNQSQQLQSGHDDSSLKKMAAAAPHCGSSNVLDGPVEGNAGNYSINGSFSGSNHGSNGQNGSSTAVNAVGGTNIESDNGIAAKSGSGDASGSGSRVDQNKFHHKVAALTKFRQKRKERCFHKKVRYQSRRRLAEQRPHLREQFMRQAANENTNRGPES